MAHSWHHAESSARRFGGKADDYLFVHDWIEVIGTIKSSIRSDGGGCPGSPWEGPRRPRSAVTRGAERAVGRDLWTHRGIRRAAHAKRPQRHPCGQAPLG